MKLIISMLMVICFTLPLTAFSDTVKKSNLEQMTETEKLKLRSDKLKEKKVSGETKKDAVFFGSEITTADYYAIREKVGDNPEKIRKELIKLSKKRIKEQKERGIN